MNLWIASAIWITCILFLGIVPSQSEFHLMLPALLGAFGTYFYFIRRQEEFTLRKIIILALLARIALIPFFPNLSDDIYRFVWDGYMWHAGLHPFSLLPSEVVDISNRFSESHFDNLNSQSYYSIYPPIPQAIFWISTLWPSDHFIVESILMKGVHCAFDIGAIFIIIRLLEKLELPKNRVLIYALNPLIIIELVGNLHHEGIVVFFIILALLMLSVEKYWKAGLAIGAAVATKILPILFCPLLFLSIKNKGKMKFLMGALLITGVLFAFLIQSTETVKHIMESADLYVRKFEFNGGIYMIAREIGYWFYGFNKIGFIGPSLMIISGIGIFLISVKAIKLEWHFHFLIPLMIWTYCLYAFLSPTLHPWYIAVLIGLCVFTNYRFPILWSSLIMLTYVNYSFIPYNESEIVVFFEYALLAIYLIYEIRRYGWLGTHKSEYPA